MGVTLQQFVDNLVQSGLMSADEVASFQRKLSSEKRLYDVQTLAMELVQAGKLTKYQAQVVYQGKIKGLVFGEYKVLDKIGQGGMGLVLKAQHRRMKRVVAVKVLPSSAMKSPEAVKRFYREAEAAAKLNHPNIVQAYDAGEHDGIHYLVMEYVEGKDLASVVKEQGPLEVKQALDCVLQAAKGLAYAHGQGVIHRDIKPANLLLDKNGTVKILDMGLARVKFTSAADETSSERLTESGQVMGTCDYMAPEQAQDTRKADQRSDVYSLGCTLYRLLTGKPPYGGDSLVSILLAHQNAPPPRLREVRPEVPESVEAIFQKMVAKRPEDRYQSMAEVIADVEALLSGSAHKPLAVLVPELPSEVLPQSLAFLQDLSPIASTTKHHKATIAENILRRALQDETGTSLGCRLKRAIAQAGRRPVVMMVAVAGGIALLVLVLGLVLNRSPSPGEIGPTDGQNQNTLSVARATKPSAQKAAPPLAVAPFDAATARKHQEAWAKYLGVEVEFTNSIGMKFVLIPPGEFEMGSDYLEVDRVVPQGWDAVRWPELVRSEAPRHRVRITKPFYLGIYEVTQDEYSRVMGSNPSHFSRTGDGKNQVAGQDTSRLPVENVSHEEAKEFCRRLSEIADEKAAARVYRLPTEAEWEYSCRAGTQTAYWTGEAPETLKGAANVGDEAMRRILGETFRGLPWDDGFAFTAPVGSFRPNPFGLYDMIGNVWEWVADLWSPDYYQRSPGENPAGPASGRGPIRRGGCFHDAHAMSLRSAFRLDGDPTAHEHINGFRVAMSIFTGQRRLSL